MTFEVSDDKFYIGSVVKPIQDINGIDVGNLGYNSVFNIC